MDPVSSTKWAKAAVSRPFLLDKEKVGATALCLGACKPAGCLDSLGTDLENPTL